MQHPNKKITDLRRLRKLYEEGAVFTAFDTETSGISPTNSRIIEIGAVQFTKDGIISKWSKAEADALAEKVLALTTEKEIVELLKASAK